MSMLFIGYLQAVDCLKSFFIATAVIDRELPVEQAVDLARLEQEFQVRLFVAVLIEIENLTVGIIICECEWYLYDCVITIGVVIWGCNQSLGQDLTSWFMWASFCAFFISACLITFVCFHVLHVSPLGLVVFDWLKRLVSKMTYNVLRYWFLVTHLCPNDLN